MHFSGTVSGLFLGVGDGVCMPFRIHAQQTRQANETHHWVKKNSLCVHIYLQICITTFEALADASN